MNIDFVVTWVDGGDPQWLSLKESYAEEGAETNQAQYRDYDIFKYWFRAVERFAPWVHRIYFVTNGQKPEWLKIGGKLQWVRHEDFIPPQYLPTFNSHAIELNLHRIEGLSEHFVYFNDDMFLTDSIEPDLFFKDGIPCETACLSVLAPSVVGDPFVHYLCNNISVVNAHFSKDVVKRNCRKWISPSLGFVNMIQNLYYMPVKCFSGFKNYHMPSAMRISTYEELWDKEYDILNETSSCRFRERTNVNQYVFSYFNICKGEFYPRNPGVGKMFTIQEQDGNEGLFEAIDTNRYKMICVNDNPDLLNFEKVKGLLAAHFEKRFPAKSQYEI